MRLKKIILDGFKSFADKTELVFDCQITAIVGPNGCGKSNVVDAIKWVLGEQSAKSLRSGQMADVIFSGSSSRKALGSAKVSLIFSDIRGTIAIDADELEISRQIYRSGESQYQINGKNCRLKDIREMLMDTGVGVKAYSIIEQGQVERLLTASKDERRSLFEEAAGISKYKAHKKEAARKLDRTEQNLLRLADVLTEVQKQLRSIKLQAGKARNFLAYNENLKQLQVNYSLVEYHKIVTKTAKDVQSLTLLEQQLSQVAAEVSRNDLAISSLGNELIETETQVNTADNHLITVRSKIEQLTQKIDFLNQSITDLYNRKRSAVDNINQLSSQHNQFETDLVKYQNQLTDCDSLSQEKSDICVGLSDQIKDVNALCNELGIQLEDEKSGIIDMIRKTAQLHNEIKSSNVYRDNLTNQKDRLKSKSDTAHDHIQTLLTEKAAHLAKASDIENLLTELSKNLNTKNQQSQTTDETIKANTNILARNKESLSALCSEQNILQDMENRREGINNTVKAFLGQNHDYVEGLLADVISSDEQHSLIIEAALEGQTDSVIISDSAKLLADTDTLNNLSSRISFLFLDRVQQSAPPTDTNNILEIDGVISIAANLIEVKDEKYQALANQLLAKTIVVESIEKAMELSAKFDTSYKFVTASGELFTGSSNLKAGPISKNSGLISRKSRIKQLRKSIETLTADTETINAELAQAQQQKSHMTKLLQDLRTAIYEANTEKTQVESKLESIEQNIDRIRKEQPILSGEIDILARQISDSVQTEHDSKQTLEDLETINSQRQQHIEELEKQLASQQSIQTAMSEKITTARIELSQVTEQRKTIQQAIENINAQAAMNNSTIISAKNEVATCSNQAEQATTDILTSESEINSLYGEKQIAQQTSRTLHKTIVTLLDQQKQAEQLIRQKRQEQSQLEEKINQLKISLSQLEVKQQNLTEYVAEELKLEIDEAYKSYADQDIDWDAVKNEISDLKGKIARLGNVNLNAIDDLDNLEQRNEFLTNQVTDLNDSKSQLEQLINQLNKTSREKFEVTFQEIRENFQIIFRKLFGGGKADIILEETDDILEAGVEIIARPPGKETRSISLLSGGEKTMTAIGLLFSMFQTKPSPFCLLDEVDAALDEANNERFNMIIKEFQKTSQFIVITHSKRTMSIVDTLYGITMQTRGVSKKISVKFGQEPKEPEQTAVA